MARVQERTIGVGAALRRAREQRRLSLEEASRDTKLPVQSLLALEDERFEVLLGDPWVRGSLRSYAHYLGLSGDKVVTAYARHTEEPEPVAPPGKPGRAERAITATRISDNHRLLFAVAVTALVVAGVLGMLSRRSDAPLPATLGSVPVPLGPLDHPIEATLAANRAASVTITVDAALPSTYHLLKGETRSFEATRTLAVRIASGGTVHLTIDGNDEGSPGTPIRAWHRTYTFATDASPSPIA